MAVHFQLVIDCGDPEPLAGFWAAALGEDGIIDPDGSGPRIWIQVVPEGN